MKIFLFSLFAALNIFTLSYSQEILLKGNVHNPPIPIENLSDWGTDLVVHSREPFGNSSGVYRNSNNTLYVSISDTGLAPNTCFGVLASTNNGSSWSLVYSATPSTVRVVKSKMFLTANDSLYCAVLVDAGAALFIININSADVRLLNSNYRDFDVHTTPSSSIFVWADSAGSNNIFRYGSTNGGVTYLTRGNVTSSGAHPRVYCPQGSDTVLLNYYDATAIVDTLTLGIRSVRYRESSPGTAATVGSFTTPIPAGTVRDMFAGVKYGQSAWIFYTSGSSGNIDLNCITSNDAGVSYGAPVTIGSMPSRDEYWFDAKHYLFGSGGVDLIYYSDSLQAGAPTTSSDKMYYTSATRTAPGTFSTPLQFSDRPLEWSARQYRPAIIEYYDANDDVGAVWIGIDGANKRIYYDRLGALVGISQNGNEIPEAFSLSQNYPNPFNPATKINFSIPKDGFVSLKVHDVLGREVATVISKDIKAGEYTVDYDATKLSTGIYFYTLTSGDFRNTKKMVLVK